MEKIILYAGPNIYQSEDRKTYCVVDSRTIVHNDKVIGEAQFQGDTHENAINRGLENSCLSVVVSYDKLWINAKLVDSHSHNSVIGKTREGMTRR